VYCTLWKIRPIRGQRGEYQPISFGKKIRKRNPKIKKVKEKEKWKNLGILKLKG
jgi:hypothetical protein